MTSIDVSLDYNSANTEEVGMGMQIPNGTE